jgi:hypothetical protein
MPNINRIRELKYKSPSGIEFTLLYSDVERSGSKKIAVHDLPQQDRAIVQDLGESPAPFSISCYLIGDDSDEIGDSLALALTEKGSGILQHPRWGDIEVIPMTWAQKESMTDGIGRVDFQIQFFPFKSTDASTGLTSTESKKDKINQITEWAVITAVKDFVASIQTQTATALSTSKTYTKDIVDKFANEMRKYATADPALAADFEKAITVFNNDLDLIFSDPEKFINNVHKIFQMPWAASSYVASKIQSYKNIIDEAVSTAGTTWNETVMACQILFGLSAGASESSTDGILENRPDSIAIEENLDSIQQSVNACISSASNYVGYVFDFEGMSGINESLITSRRYILDNLYNLKTEIVITIASEIPPIKMCWLYYKDVSKLQKFITDNKLKGNEIILLPVGRQVVFYV